MAARKATAFALAIIAIVLMISSDTLAAGSRGVTVKPKAGKLASEGRLYETGHALVIGVDAYRDQVCPRMQRKVSVGTPDGTISRSYQPGDTFKDCADCPEMIVVPVDSFMMGDLNGVGDNHEKPVHRVTFEWPFAVGVYEVTQAEWRAVMGNNPSKYKGDRNPVELVSWDDAKEFLKTLSEKTGKEYRLLSEAEWEYVARAKSRTEYPWGDDIDSSKANYGNKVGTRAVGSYGANEFGLYDTAGNVWEWIEDCWTGTYNFAPSNGSSWGEDCSLRGLRGGSWRSDPRHLRSAIRIWDTPSERGATLGFRIARTVSW
jgi:formylglycine-generating enzyme required for sulfatase activity